MQVKDLDKSRIQELKSKYLDKLINSDEALTQEEAQDLKAELEKIDEYVLALEKAKLELGHIYDLNELKKHFSVQEVKDFYTQDNEYIQQINGYLENNFKKRNYMFGYPSNMQSYSYTTKYMRFLESKLYLMNNCGDPYQRGNYGMDSKLIEKDIISLFAKNFGLKEGEYWGYITSGGTESNYWAIREGFNNFPDGKLYFSKSAHYSVEKFVRNNEKIVYSYEMIDDNGDGTICADILLKKIKSDFENGVKGAILVLTWGTTCFGSIDEVKRITEYLISHGIPYYCHLDAANFGGIPENQINSPVLNNVKALNVNSLSISLHKYLGMPRVNGILMAFSKADRNVVEYIGQEDSTYLGSRDYLPFSTLQRAREILLRSPENNYAANVEFFDKQLKDNGITFFRFENSNTFVIDKPSDEICKKYQLATFFDGDKEKAHIIIYPFHKKQIMQELVEEIKK